METGERRRWIPAAEVIAQLERIGTDRTGLQQELDEMLSESTDDLPR